MRNTNKFVFGHAAVVLMTIAALPLFGQENVTTGSLGIPAHVNRPFRPSSKPGADLRKGPSRIGFVDIELIIENSRAIKSLLDQVDQQLSDLARQIDAKKRDFRRARFDLDQQERVLTDVEREKRRGELSNMLDEINDMEFRMEKELRNRQQQVDPVLQKIMDIVADVGEREGFDLIVRGEVAIYGARTVDVTPLVVEELDKRTDEVKKLFEKKPTSLDDDTTTGTERRSPRDGGGTNESLPLIP